MEPKFRFWNKIVGRMTLKSYTLQEICDSEINFNLLNIMQYVDLKDKHGIEYCQDDIVKYRNKFYRLIKGNYQFELVGFSESSQCTPSDFFSEDAFKEGEIVGNIYETPELSFDINFQL